MVRVLELRRAFLAALFGFAVLAACSSNGTDGTDGIVSAIRDDLTSKDTSGPNPAATLTRAQIEALGVALIRVRETLIPETNLLIALRKSGPQVTYVLRAERRLILHGGLIQSTHGFGDNLEPIAVTQSDPIAYPRPLRAWPESVTRTYTVSDRGPGRPVMVRCRFMRGASGAIEIVERKVNVQTVQETCKGSDLEFTNRHFVDKTTGAIWRSQQWTGPQQGMLIYEVLEPLDP